MTHPKMENRITTGNLISLTATFVTTVGVIVSVSLWAGKQDQRMIDSERRIERNATAVAANEVRIRAMESASARQDEKLTLILEQLREIRAMIGAP